MARADEAFEKALRLIDEDRLGVEDCLAAFSPAEADRLRPLLLTILEVKERALMAPAPVRQEEKKAVFLAELAALQGTGGAAEDAVRGASASFRNWLTTRLGHTFAAAAAAVVLTGGVATAAGHSGPASPLYPVKRAVEAVETVLPRSDFAQAKLHLDLAEKRLAELEQAEESQDSVYESLNEEFNSELAEAKEIAARLSYVERRQTLDRYEELELRYKNVSHRRLDDIDSVEEPKVNKGAGAAPAGDDRKAGDDGDDGEHEEDPKTPEPGNSEKEEPGESKDQQFKESDAGDRKDDARQPEERPSRKEPESKEKSERQGSEEDRDSDGTPGAREDD